MKAEKLTSKVLTNLKADDIIYAEFAEGGAMGDAGTARIYTYDGKVLRFYLVSLSKDNTESDIHSYADAYTLLRDLESKKQLQYADGGFGNHVWKNPTATFTRDDDNACFIFTPTKSSEFSIETSVDGVYFHIVAVFAERPVSIKALTKFRKKIAKKSTFEEIAFYDAYLAAVERTDSGVSGFDITVDDYWSAINYIQSLSYEQFNLSNDAIFHGITAVQKYRLKSLIEKIGWRTLDGFIAELITLKSTDLFFELNKFINSMDNSVHDENYIPYNINHLFTDIKYVSSNHSDLDPLSPSCITHLFEYPTIVKFTASAHEHILREMAEATPNQLREHAVAMSYYIANFIMNEDTLSYADILPACVNIINDLPADDLNHTNTPYLFWLAAEVIDRIWRYASENKSSQKKCRNLVYGLFLPRIGGIWPLVHYDEFDFKHEAADRIFRESVSFVMALDDICERNADIKTFLSSYEKGHEYPLWQLTHRAFLETLKPIEASGDRIEKILTDIPPADYPRYLDHPSTVKEAAKILEELFRTDPDARITGLIRIATFERLLLNGNSIGVGVAILNHLVKHFDEFSAIITTDCEKESLDPLDVITSLYTAAAAGATEENELPPLKALTKKISKYVISLQISQTMNAGSLKGQDIRSSKIDVTVITEAALRYARKHRRTILFQRSALQKLF